MKWLMIALMAVALPVHAGPRTIGNGGDEIGLEFEGAARTAAENTKKYLKPLLGSSLQIDWSKALSGLTILVVDEPLFVESGSVKQESVAVNYPGTRTIKINRKRWKEISGLRIKEGIALHEILSLEGLEATGRYPYSAIYLSYFGYAPDSVLGDGIKKKIIIPDEVNTVYSYKCRRTFFEGEGVTLYGVDCPARQKLGFLFAEYTYFLFRSPSGDNFSSKATEAVFDQSICGLAVNKYSCDFAPAAQFGLAPYQTSDFPVPITLTPNPDGRDTGTYGYAALPDPFGKCPEGLVKARQLDAQPSSHLDPLPSNFINHSNNLNDRLVSTETLPMPFELWRKPAITGCDEKGFCAPPDGGFERVQSTHYMALTPVACVIPRGVSQ
jgi:hypothetical protein